MKFTELDAEMRKREMFHGLRLPSDCYVILRLDGRSFSKLTNERFEKPFDVRFHGLMLSTARMVMEEFRGVYCYTESDEISILLPLKFDMFDRELEKLISVSASIASAEFTAIAGFVGTFDSRAWVSGSAQQVIDYFSWRQADASRCCLNGYAYWTLRKAGQSARRASRALEGMPSSHKHNLLHEHGINFNDLPLWQRRGMGFYWETYLKDGVNPMTGETVTTCRRRLACDEELPMKDEYREFIAQLIGGLR